MDDGAGTRYGRWIERRVLRSIGFLFALTCAGPGPAAAQTILNVERLQPGDVEGTHWGVEGEFSLSRGNDEILDVLGGVVLGHRWEERWLRAFVGYDYYSEAGAPVESDRYLHVRYNHWWTDRWQSFHFVQYQASRTSLLQRRALVGSGIRLRLVDGRTTFDVGTGVVREEEDLDGERLSGAHPARPRVWRMANLLVGTRRLSESLRLVGVAYVQRPVRLRRSPHAHRPVAPDRADGQRGPHPAWRMAARLEAPGGGTPGRRGSEHGFHRVVPVTPMSFRVTSMPCR